MNSVLNAIVSVSNEYSRSLIKLNINIDRSPLIIEAINLVISSSKDDLFEFKQNILNEKLILSSIDDIAKKIQTSFPKPIHPIFLETINRNRDENLHSDYIAAIIRLHPEILKLLNMNGTFINIRREVRLDYFDSNLEGSMLGARRIDLLVESDKEFLILENKIDSRESRDQTQDYYQVIKRNTLKEVKGLLLSPLGLEPMCEKYRKITYYQLFLIFNQIEKKSPVLDYYLSELFDIFIKPFNRSVHETRGS